MRILLVEDDPMIAQAIKGALSDEMYTVEQVANGRDALMMLSVNEYGFLLLDLGLPGVDGMTVLRTLRANAEGQKKNIPVIILTARDGLDDRLEGLDAGADDYLVKPFHMSELLARIRAVLRRKNQTTENALTNGLVTVNNRYGGRRLNPHCLIKTRIRAFGGSVGQTRHNPFPQTH